MNLSATLNHNPQLTKSARRYDIDAMRVLAFGLLILYHVGMFYVEGWHWHVKSSYLSEPLKAVMQLVNPWRMSLIFLISGVAVHFLLRKTSVRGFAGSRIKRLVIPLLFGMAVIVPPQAYVQAVSSGAFEGSYMTFLVRYFTFQPWPVGAFDGSEPVGITWNHLWYLPYLLTYSLLLAALLPILRTRALQRFVLAFHAMRGWQVLVLPVLPFHLYEWLLAGRFPVTHAYLDDWHCHAVSITAFFVGYLLGSRETLWKELQRLRWLTLLLAMASYTYLVGFDPVASEWGVYNHGIRTLLSSFNGWFWLLTVMGWGYHRLNRPTRWLPYATEAVYSWYMLHQTITVVAGYYLSRLYLGPIVEPLLVLTATVVGCLVVHEFVIRRVEFVRPLFGMKRSKPLRNFNMTEANGEARRKNNIWNRS